MLSPSSDPPMDVQKDAALPAATKEEDLSCCTAASLKVFMVLYSLYMVGLIIWMFKVCENWWQAWPAVFLVLVWVLVLLVLAEQHAKVTLSESSDHCLDLEKGAGPALTKEEELAKVNSGIAKGIMVVLDVMMVFYSLFMIGLMIYMVKVSTNNLWDAWSGVVIVLPIWVLSLYMHFQQRAKKRALLSNGSNLSTKLLESTK
ncbi:hypothetical protein CFC21_089614 [Triticum aestivum]|uniref:Transmembrane protein 208 n=2 Tax=Triticum aestivum TaxID=4565 RepID=A0A9R1ILL1_WHEAT|nr:uncharacterized protein LOC123134738 [Triticum aestivum]KAF7086312.1 hypothetical protein CFC21_089613 [Triticum aestivum]KAF7086313.1 hypothetical protein CFC21_089614 [Triticum aestivum]